MSKSRTIYDKIWDDHLVNTNDDGTSLIYIDRHLVHEVTSPQAFEGLRMTKRKVRCCLLYTSPSPRDGLLSRMPSSA